MKVLDEKFRSRGEGQSLKLFRQRLAALIFAVGTLTVGSILMGQQSKPIEAGMPFQAAGVRFGNTRWFPTFWEPYVAPVVPEPTMSNSERLQSLLKDGKLHLSVQDAIALALENNLDIAVGRYNIDYSQTDILRTQGGGAARGFSGSFTSGALFSGAIGGGVNASAGGGGGRAGGISGSAGATQLGGGTFDPAVSFSMGWDQNTSPLGTTVVTGVPFVTSQGTSYSSSLTQAFETGTSYEVILGGSRGTTTSLNSSYNPQVNTFMGAGFTQPLLNGFGRRANGAQIRIAKNDRKVADSVFRQQVITTIAQILNYYWDFVTFEENVQVAQHALTYARKLLSDNQRQVQTGTLAPLEVVRADSEVSARLQDLIVAQTTMQQQAELIKTALTRQVSPELADAELVPDDKLPEPQADDVPPLAVALQVAFANRPEIEQMDLKFKDQDTTIQARRNSLLPSLNVFASYIATGLSGNQLLCALGDTRRGNACSVPGDGLVPPLGTSVGGVNQAFTQTWQGHYPDYSLGLNLNIPIRNRAAQADAARALVERRQLATQLQQSKNNIAQQVRTAKIGVIQAKVQIDAAVKGAQLAQQTVDAEQEKFHYGGSTVFMVIQAQRDLAIAEGNEVKARSTYAKALTQFQLQTATILQKYGVEMSDAVSGEVKHTPNIPGSAGQPRPQNLETPPQS